MKLIHFLEKIEILKQTQEETINRPKIIKEVESELKYLSSYAPPQANNVRDEIYQTFRK